jgi:hypothetical protein
MSIHSTAVHGAGEEKPETTSLTGTQVSVISTPLNSPMIYTINNQITDSTNKISALSTSLVTDTNPESKLASITIVKTTLVT